MADPTKEINLTSFLSSVALKPTGATPTPMIEGHLEKTTETVSQEDRFLACLASVLFNIERKEGERFNRGKIQDSIGKIDQLISKQINEILHNEQFQAMESAWRSLYDLVSHVNFKANIMIDMMDVTKEELYEDFENNSVDIASGELFKKVYVHEYDQFGGKPFGGMISLFSFDHTPRDEFFLKQIGKVANASHAPFVGTISPKFFGCNTVQELASLKDLEGLMNQPKYGSWNQLRESPEAAYIGLTLPKYILRLPYSPESNPCYDAKGNIFPFKEDMGMSENNRYVWGASSMLFARNMAKSFETSGWCQYIRGPKGGGLISGLPAHTFNIRGENEIKVPVEIAIPDYRELEFANCGFIPLIYRKGSSEACFFSCQSLKKAIKFKDPKDSENSQLVSNLSYTMSITRIAHYIKCIMRDNIGTTADAAYIQNKLSTWISRYVTTVINPDDLTLRYYPFKAAAVEVINRPGAIGWYHCTMSILPHIQFEGMDVELRLESRL